jgi:SAM-dependent methyltransferase
MALHDRYTSGAYLAENPDWHVADSPWKAQQVLRALRGWEPRTICEVGCGAGEILRQLHDRLPAAELVGYEIAPAALELAESRRTERLRFRLQDAAQDGQRFELMLLMDIIEHVPDPIGFLAGLRFKADRVMVHIPLDLCVLSTLRPGALLEKRRALGHVHYFTEETAVATVLDAGYRVLDAMPTRTFELWGPSWKGRTARRLLRERLSRRILGGYSLLVTAEPPADR